jgi:hypothetical protein
VFYETSFDSKQPKLEPKLVLILSETRRVFRFNIETACFGVSVEPNQKKTEPKIRKPVNEFKYSTGSATIRSTHHTINASDFFHLSPEPWML